MDQFKVLDAIRANGPVTVREVCALLGSEDFQNISKKGHCTQPLGTD